MADALRCDRCGKFYSKPWGPGVRMRNTFHEIDTITRNVNGMKRTTNNYDLCLKCARDLTNWLKLKGEFVSSTDTEGGEEIPDDELDNEPKDEEIPDEEISDEGEY